MTTWHYDAANNQIGILDPLGHMTDYGFDGLDRVTSIVQPDPDGGGPLTNPTTLFTYDAVGNMLSLRDPVNNTTTWAYDGLDRVISETNQVSDARTFDYDAVGNLIKKTDRNGRVTEYAYDNRRKWPRRCTPATAWAG